MAKCESAFVLDPASLRQCLRGGWRNIPTKTNEITDTIKATQSWGGLRSWVIIICAFAARLRIHIQLITEEKEIQNMNIFETFLFQYQMPRKEKWELWVSQCSEGAILGSVSNIFDIPILVRQSLGTRQCYVRKWKHLINCSESVHPYTNTYASLMTFLGGYLPASRVYNVIHKTKAAPVRSVSYWRDRENRRWGLKLTQTAGLNRWSLTCLQQICFWMQVMTKTCLSVSGEVMWVYKK